MKPPEITLSQWGACTIVRYPHRKTSNMYMALNGCLVFCAQCNAELPDHALAFLEHLVVHAGRSRTVAEAILHQYREVANG